MSLNNRVMRHVVNNQSLYGLHEVYYNEKGEAENWSEKPTTGLFESVEELEGHLLILVKDLARNNNENSILEYT
jgi:hypothetical protein